MDMEAHPSIISFFYEETIRFLLDKLGDYFGTPLPRSSLLRIFLPLVLLLFFSFRTQVLQWVVYSIPAIRRIRDPREGLVGDWVETIIKKDVTFFTLVSMIYEVESRDYRIEGITISRKGIEHAYFHSHMISFFAEPETLEVVYHATFKSNRKQTKGYAAYRFMRVSSMLEILGGRRFENEGDGYIVDFHLEEHSDPAKEQHLIEPQRILSFDLERLSTKLVKSLIGKRRAGSASDRRMLAVKYGELKLQILRSALPK
jgi:hypothetical protein